MQTNPQIWTVNSILAYHYGEILLAEEGCACLKLGDFYYLEGDFSEVFADILLQKIEAPAIITSSNSSWYSFLMEKFSFAELVSRWMYEWHRDASLVEKYLMVPSSYRIKNITQIEAEAISKLIWAEGIFNSYHHIEDFLMRGFGYCILHNDKIISLCMSFSQSAAGVEIEVDTDPAYQKQGLAKIVAAYFIKEALQRKILPLWDATNLASVKIAEALGFKFVKKYEALSIE